jgi:hypothetical protein
MHSKWTNRTNGMHDKSEPMAAERNHAKREEMIVLTRILGGSPLGTLARLVLLSIVVGFILAVAGVDPRDIFRSVERLIRQLLDLGLEPLRWLWHYFLLGAVLVVPIWLVVRLTRGLAGRN